MTVRFTLYGDRERKAACAEIMRSPDLYRITIDEPRRSDSQSDKMWALIGDIKKQKPDWFGPSMNKDDIKQVFMSALFKELRMARNADGDGYVPISHRSSTLSYAKMGELITLMTVWCVVNGVTLKESSTAGSTPARVGVCAA